MATTYQQAVSQRKRSAIIVALAELKEEDAVYAAMHHLVTRPLHPSSYLVDCIMDRLVADYIPNTGDNKQMDELYAVIKDDVTLTLTYGRAAVLADYDWVNVNQLLPEHLHEEGRGPIPSAWMELADA